MTLKHSNNPSICYPDDVLTKEVNDEQQWMVVYTKPRHEKALAWNLRQNNIGYFLPMIKTRQNSQKRIRYSMLPLFTSYVFVQVNSEAERVAALKTNRIVQMIHVEDQKLLREELHTVYKAISNRPVDIYLSDLKTGQKVRVINGPLYGLEGILIEQKNAKSLLIEVESVSKTIRVEIESDKVELVD